MTAVAHLAAPASIARHPRSHVKIVAAPEHSTPLKPYTVTSSSADDDHNSGVADAQRTVELYDLDDAQLIDAVREGTTAAYGELYQRHINAAYNLARQLTRCSAEADDLVSEAFSKVLDTLRARRGPDSAFRAYLLTALRHTAYDKTRKNRKLELAEDVTTVVNPDLVSVPFNDTVAADVEQHLAAKAFARLPERWQTVLWLTEIEGRSPREVAPSLGITPNSVSALAYRAREGLRQAYLQAHLAEAVSNRCQPTVELLGAWTRNGLSEEETKQVEEHLAACSSCYTLSAELAEINGEFRIGAAAKRSRRRNTKNRRPRGGQLPLTIEIGYSSISGKLAS